MNIDLLKEQLLADDDVRRRIGRRAYEIYLERRGYHDAHPSEDWLRAESEVLPRLIEEIVAENQRAIASHDDTSDTAHRAAEHMQEELAVASSDVSASANGFAQIQANAAALTASDDSGSVPNAWDILETSDSSPAPASERTTGASAKQAATKAAATKSAPKKPAAKKPATKKAASKKAAPKKAAAKKAGAPKAAAKAPSRAAASKATPKAAPKEPAKKAALTPDVKPILRKAAGRPQKTD